MAWQASRICSTPREYASENYCDIKEMTEKPEIQSQQDIEFKKELEKVKWPIEYGIISIQVRNSKPTLLKIERTVKMD